MTGTEEQEDSRKITELIEESNDMAMLTTKSPDGKMVSRPMALQKADFDGALWFFADRQSSKMDEIAADPNVNVTFGSASTWVSFAGRAQVVKDPERKRDLWNSVVDAWFPEGPESEDVILLKVDGETAEYWDSPGGRLATVLSFAKAKVTGEPYSGGENETVDISGDNA